jgi:plastocyanin
MGQTADLVHVGLCSVRTASMMTGGTSELPPSAPGGKASAMNARRACLVVVLALGIEGCGTAATSPSTATSTSTVASSSAVSASPSEAVQSATPISTATPLPALASTSVVASDAPKGAIPVVMTAVGDSEHGKPVYQPDKITAKAGTVVFFLQNVPPAGCSCDHNMMIGPSVGRSFAGSMDVNRNENVIFTVNDLTPGAYPFWCSIVAPNGTTHASSGMVGELTITP